MTAGHRSARRQATARAAALAIALALGGGPPGAAASERSWNFRVTLDDRDIGQHRFTLSTRESGERELRSEARFDVRVLFIDAFRYRHEARERWQGDCLRALEARTDTNGTVEAVQAKTEAGRLAVETGSRRETHEGCVMSFAYWNPRMLEARRLLNSQTGELLPVRVTRMGEEPIEAGGRTVTSQRYRVEAPKLSIDLWYAGEQWLALESPAAGGRRLRYRLH